ncbi:hypothetical protein R7034_26180, partial [Vibrio sp. 1833]|uniref:hypothetical protein n=1 Tax=Vibrio sp. 1833 TaxID=3074578 RepID=UPI002964B05D
SRWSPITLNTLLSNVLFHFDHLNVPFKLLSGLVFVMVCNVMPRCYTLARVSNLYHWCINGK